MKKRKMHYWDENPEYKTKCGRFIGSHAIVAVIPRHTVTCLRCRAAMKGKK